MLTVNLATAVCWIGLGTLKVRWIAAYGRLPRSANQWLSVSCWLFRCANWISPDHHMALRYLAWCLAEIGEPARALEHYQRLVAKYPSFAEGRLEIGEALNALGRNSEAIEHLERALVESPRDARVLRALAATLLLLNHPADARALCERCVEQDDRDEAAWGLLGLALARASAWHDALRAYERAHGLGHERIAFQYAWTLAELDRFEEAERVLRGAIPSRDDNSELRALLAYVLQEQNRHTDAESELRSILQADPANRQARGGLASFLASRGRLSEATEIAAALRADAPDEADSHAVFGWVALKDGRSQDALTAYDAALLLEPGWPGSLAGRAMALSRLGRQSEARAAVRAAVNRDPTFFDRHREWSEVSTLVSEPVAGSR